MQRRESHSTSDCKMIGPAETATVAFLQLASPGVSSVSSRDGQTQGLIIAPPAWVVDGTYIPKAHEKGSSAVDDQSYLAGIDGQQTRADLAIRQLIQMAGWDANWDGNGADRPLNYSLLAARAFVRALAPDSIIPRPALHADGHAILFIQGPDYYAELEFLGDRRIGYYARRGRLEWGDEINFDGHVLPQGLSDIGFIVWEPPVDVAA